MSEEQKKSKGSPAEKNKKLFADKSLLTSEWTKCLDRPDALLCAWFLPCCMMPCQCSLTDSASNRILNMAALFCCGCWLCGFQRSHIQKKIGVEDDGIVWNCIMHLCCCVAPCSLVQEYRGIIRWKKSESDSFKKKWKETGKMVWDMSLMVITNLDME